MIRSTPIAGIRCTVLAAAGLALAGCNTMSSSPPASTTSAAAATFQLPDGKPCSGSIRKFQDVTQGDYTTGNVNPTVYKTIQGEIAKAAEACSAGRDAEARAIVAASRRKHGYPS